MWDEGASINLLRTDHYKVTVLLGCSKMLMHAVSAVLDTGAGPNLVREDLLPADWHKYAQNVAELPRICDANNRRLKVAGVVPMYVDIGGRRLQTSFLVCKELAAPAILGCSFIQRFVSAILPQENKVVLKYGGAIAIQSRKRDVVALIDRTPKVKDHPCPQKCRGNKQSAQLRLVKPVVVPPYAEALIQVMSDKSGILKVSPAERLMRKHKISIPYGIIDALTGSPLTMKVANFSRRAVRLRKGTIVGLAAQRPKFIVCPLEREGNIDQEGHAPQSDDWLGEVSLEHLDEKLRRKVVTLLRKYADVCDGRLGTIKGAPHRIDIIPGAKPVFQQPYRCGIERRKAEEAEVARMLKAGVITPSNAEWASPVILVPKPDGSLRFCVDYRKLNGITVRDSYPMPRMDECIDSLGSATVFSTLDCNSGYWQLPVAREDQDKTTFTCHAGSYKFLRLPFGLRNAPATFQRAMDIILARVRWRFVLVYLDDIIIFSRGAEEHLSHLESVLKLLQEAGATLRIPKCHFFKEQVKYLGHILRPGKLAIYGRNLEAINKAMPPKNKTQVRSFLGMCNVYRRFVAGYTKIAHPLNQKVRKDQPETWETLSPEEIEAFNQLKKSLVTAPILALPREGYPYTLDTDASEYQLGCCLLQAQPDGALHPIGYWSRSLTPAEKNYSSTEKECLALVWAVQYLRPYLEGQRFTIRTDHDALKWLMNLRDPRGRLARWSLRLQEYDYEVIYKPGRSHALADGPSRLSTLGLDESHFDDDIPCLPRNSKALFKSSVPGSNRSEWPTPKTEVNSILLTERDAQKCPISIDEMISEQSSDDYCQWARRNMDIAQGNSPFAINQHGVLVRKSKLDGSLQIIVPTTLRARLLDIAHSAPIAGHPGRAKMYQTLRRQFYWPSMTVDIHHQVENCKSCAMNRIKDQRNVYPMRLFPARRPLEYVAMDILGPFPRTKHGMRFILVITDRFSKLTRTVALRTITSLSVAKAFCRTWVFSYGTPKILLTDNGSQFAASFFRDVCRLLGIQKVFTTEYHPQANGQAERFNRTILAALRDYVSDTQRDWDEWLGPLTYAYNMQVHRSTGTTPFDLVLSRHPPPLLVEEDMLEHVPHVSARERRARISRAKQEFLARLRDLVAKASQNLARTQQRYKRNFDSRIRERLRDIKPGAYVYREIPDHPEGVNPKLARQVDGPYLVLANRWPVIVIEVRGRPVTVNANRLVRAPTPRQSRQGIREQRLTRASTPERAGAHQRIATPPEGGSTGSTNAPPVRQESARVRDATRNAASRLHETTASQRARPHVPAESTSASAESQGRSSETRMNHRAIQDSLQESPRRSQRLATRAQPDEYVIEGIVGAGQDSDGSELYRVRWEGYGPEDDTWEPAANLPRSLVSAYKRAHGIR